MTGQPGTTLDTVLAGLWERLLGYRPQPDSDFFALGGDSMIGLSLTNHVNKEFAVAADLSLVFQHRRFGDYVDAVRVLVDRERDGGGVGSLSATTATGDGWHDGLSYNQRKRLRAMARRRRAGEPQRPKNVLLVLELGGEVDSGRVEAALTDVVDHQPALRTTFDVDGAAPRWRCADEVDRVVVDRPGLPPDDVERAVTGRIARLMGTVIPVDRPPLLRAELLTVAPGRHLLLVAVEHMVCDRVSIDILRWELLTAYAARAAGRTPELPPVGTHPQLLLAERDRRIEEDADGLLAQWRDALAGLDHRPEFDLSPQRAALPLPQPVEQRTIRLAGPRGGELLARCAEYGFSETATVLSAVYLALRATTGSTDIPLVVAAAGRDTAEAERLMNWFADLLVVRCRTGGDPAALPFGEVVAAVQTEMWAAHRRAVPFNLLLERVCGVPQAGKADFPWVFVSYLKHTPVELAGAGLGASVPRMPAGDAYFHGPSIEIEADPAGVEIHVTTVAGRYGPAVVDRFVAALDGTLNALATRPWG